MQKFLALAFRQAGFTHIEERGVQGVDLDAASDTKKYTTEVKITIKDSVQFHGDGAMRQSQVYLDDVLHKLIWTTHSSPRWRISWPGYSASACS